MIDKARLQAVLWDKEVEAEHKHHTGELSLVSIAVTCMGTKRVHIANIPPEVSNDALRSRRTSPHRDRHVSRPSVGRHTLNELHNVKLSASPHLSAPRPGRHLRTEGGTSAISLV